MVIVHIQVSTVFQHLKSALKHWRCTWSIPLVFGEKHSWNIKVVKRYLKFDTLKFSQLYVNFFYPLFIHILFSLLCLSPFTLDFQDHFNRKTIYGSLNVHMDIIRCYICTCVTFYQQQLRSATNFPKSQWRSVLPLITRFDLNYFQLCNWLVFFFLLIFILI